MDKLQKLKDIFGTITPPQQNTHRWYAEDVSSLGTLLLNLGNTLTTAASRLHRWDLNEFVKNEKDPDTLGIEVRSPSTLNDAVETLCSLTWNMRVDINRGVYISRVRDVAELLDWKAGMKELTSLKQKTSSPVAVAALQEEISKLQVKIDDANEYINSGKNDEDYLSVLDNADMLSGRRTTIGEDEDIGVLLEFFSKGEGSWFTFGDVGKYKLQQAIEHLRDSGITFIYQLLNASKDSIREIVGPPSTGKLEVLTEVLHSYGFKWRTNGIETRFDLPVGRFPFSKAAYRTRSERRAATALLKRSKLGFRLRESVKFVLGYAHEVSEGAAAQSSLTGDEIRGDWFKNVTWILKNFKGIIPERLWLTECVMDHKVSKIIDGEKLRVQYGDYRYTGTLVDAIRNAETQERHFKHQGKLPGEISVTSSLQNSDFWTNYYFRQSTHFVPRTKGEEVTEKNEHHKTRGQFQTCNIHQLVHVVTRIIFEWIKSVELNAMVKKNDELKGLEDEYLWDWDLADKGEMPLGWNVEDIDPDNGGWYQFTAPIELGEKLKYANEN